MILEKLLGGRRSLALQHAGFYLEIVPHIGSDLVKCQHHIAQAELGSNEDGQKLGDLGRRLTPLLSCAPEFVPLVLYYLRDSQQTPTENNRAGVDERSVQ
jgi:hypothetical protein